MKVSFPAKATMQRAKTLKNEKIQKSYNTLVTTYFSSMAVKSNVSMFSSMQMSSGISSVEHHNPHINFFVLCHLTQELIVDEIHFFNFLYVSSKPLTRPAKSYYWYTWCKFLWIFPSVPGMGNTWWTNTKTQQLIKYFKISYSIALLVFRKCSSVTYRNDIIQDT